MKLQYSPWIIAAAVAVLINNVPLHASDIDDRIVASAKQSYVFKNYLNTELIQILSKNGDVTLTGTVSSDPLETLAEDTVNGLPGVKSVNNQLEIRGERHAKDSNAWLTEKVKTTLMFHRNVSAGDTKVSVKEGRVTLRGKASSQAQRALTSEYVKDVEGVKGVTNKMTVSRILNRSGKTVGENIDDGSITAQAKMTLLFHRSISAGKIGIETKEGIVTLSGKALNRAEKELAAKLVYDIYGVKSVINNMIIDEYISRNG